MSFGALSHETPVTAALILDPFALDEPEPLIRPPSVFGYDSGISPLTIVEWQRQIDDVMGVYDHLSRFVLRWEAGDPWQRIDRWVIWQCVDPKVITVEPWNLAGIRGPNPRTTGGHYCAAGWCYCARKRNRYVQPPRAQGGVTRLIDVGTWRLYHDTGLYGKRWWTIQGNAGGHRFQLGQDDDAAEMMMRQARGLTPDTPAVGDGPYAPVDNRVLHAIYRCKRLNIATETLTNQKKAKRSLLAEERQSAEALAQAMWDWTGDQAESLWESGAGMLPKYFEDTHGRVPTGSGIRPLDETQVAERFFGEAALGQ